MELLVSNFLTTNFRRATMRGKKYIVADATLIVPGVLNGSRGRLYYPSEEVSANVDQWNGIPMVVYHPQKNGQHVSARSPEILNEYQIGEVLRNQFKGKHISELWFDEEATNNYDKKLQQEHKIMPRLLAGKPISLSTGLYTDNQPMRGTCPITGREYDAVARNYRPDHLAILPDQKGACDITDGCGVNVNAFCATGAGGGQDPSCGNDSGTKTDTQPAQREHKDASGSKFNPDTGLHPHEEHALKELKDAREKRGSNFKSEDEHQLEAQGHARLREVDRQVEEGAGGRSAPAKGGSKGDGKGDLFGSTQGGSAHGSVIATSDKENRKLEKKLAKEKTRNQYLANVEQVITGNLRLDELIDCEDECDGDGDCIDDCLDELSGNAFCATGAGGGVDPSCGGENSGGSASMKVEVETDPNKTWAGKYKVGEKSFTSKKEGQEYIKSVKVAEKTGKDITSEQWHDMEGKQQKVWAEVHLPGFRELGPNERNVTLTKLSSDLRVEKSIRDSKRADGTQKNIFDHWAESAREWERVAREKYKTTNAFAVGVHGNPKSLNTGKFKPIGAGFGEGDLHEASQRGAMQFTERDRELGAIAKTDTSWVADNDTWQKAKAATDKGYSDSDDVYWTIAAHIYRNMGGEIKESTNNQENTMPLTREQIITDLTTNCDCWKGAKDVLNSMTDDRLVKIKQQHDGAAKATIIVNKLKEPHTFKDGDKERQLVFNAESGTFVVNDGMVCPECGGNMTNGTCDDCGYTAEATPSEKKKAPPFPVAANQSRLTKEEREDLAYAKKMRVQNKQGLIRRIVANSNATTKEQQSTLVRNLNAKDEGTLETILACQPQRAQQVSNEAEEDVSWFFGGAGGAATHNRRQDADDIAVLEQDAQDMMPATLNYEELVENNRKHAV